MRTAAIAVAALLALSACGLEPCEQLVHKICGVEDACRDRAGCGHARDLRDDGVATACEAALENELSYPPCRR